MATSKLYLLNWNVYYNKRVKIIQVSDLGQAFFSQSNINFNPGDGVNASQTLNYNEARQPDYLVETQIVNGVETIKSRWYIIEAERTRLNQYNLVLKRDLLADYWSDIATSTAYIKKGWVANTSDLIFNQEGVKLNQIKTNEILLKDKSLTPWIVGYLGAKAFEQDVSISITGSTEATIFANNNSELLNLYPGSNFTGAGNLGGGSEGFSYEFYVKCIDKDSPTTIKMYKITLGSSGYKIEVGTNDDINKEVFLITNYNLSEFDFAVGRLVMYLAPKMNSISEFAIYYDFDNNIDDQANANEAKCRSIDRSIAQVSENYYQMNFRTQKAMLNKANYVMSDARAQMTWLRDNLDQAGMYGYGTPNWNSSTTADARVVKITNTTYYWYGTWKAVINSYTTGNLKGVVQCVDAPYYMFCIPYQSIDFRVTASGSDITSDSNISFQIANEMIRQFGVNLYDIQILPYFPVQEILGEPFTNPNTGQRTGYINLSQLKKSNYTLITQTEQNNPISFIFWSPKTTFSFSIEQTLAAWTNLKAQNETELVRLCSPNYASYYEFSIAKNRGVSSFNVDCNYKPGIPYIHVCPKFNELGLYGQNFGDARGLICSGDFSMTQIQDQFINYQLQNKNYNLIFDRQMQSMDLKHKIGNEEDIWNVVTGTIGGAAGGLTGGALAGGGIGASIGATVGGAAALAGGLRDISLNKKLRADEADSARTIQSLSIGNIQAMPDTLTKVTAQNQNNKLFPFIEIYRATQIELDAFVNYIKWNGMTVGIVDQLNKWYNPSEEASTNYIEADIIRLDIPDDSHIVSEIANELRKGVYIEKL